MMHLLLELPVGQITASPFAPLITCGMDIPAHELEFLPKRAIATILPSISGYVGADTVSAILSCGMMEKSETALLIDIGTNGEIVLTHENKLLCCSAAAGPAFEGAHIACGMGGVEGAISHVRTSNGRISFEVIGDGEPVGICGSGLVDAVAALLSIGALDETGRFDSEACPESNFLLDGKPAVRISENVYLTQRDVREVQLAKAAIAAGIEILLLEAGITVEQIQCVYLAGGFGSHIDPASACRIGILPTSALPHIRVVGNAAGSGARAALLDRNIRKKADDVRTKVKYIELSVHADFQDHFIEQMMFS